ncbi:MAG: Re/Si-specific NAD(P)(+) transhydrogenase subunit alpha [Leptolyngbyaceae cyanobacterium bins.302]|nr:Re/Si-specific NAD(P)(+) transhydrogenase subunit alpha [Leptolyngbyaceae cyanobacterium bins.302]
MRIAIAKEIESGERRVALIPDTIGRLVKQGFEIWVERGAGEAAYFSDQAYVEAGAAIVPDAETAFSADLVLKVKPPQRREDGRHEASLLQPGSALISFLDPLGNPDLCQQLAERNVTAFSMELIPRISRAQSMDALSSQASLAGYKAVLIAASVCPKFFPMLTTAAGTIPPAKVFIIGAGVAGLQAIATARRLGAVVEAFDIRPAVKEEVQSLGAKFVEVALEEDTVAQGGYAKEVSELTKQKTQEAIAAHVKQADVVITTAQVPGRKAPLLVTEAMIAAMKPGAVIVDMAAEQGGNCAGTEAGSQIVRDGVTLIGPVNLPATMPVHASQMYAKNLLTLVQHLVKDGQLVLDFDDEITREACVTHGREIRSERVRTLLNHAVAVGS